MSMRCVWLGLICAGLLAGSGCKTARPAGTDRTVHHVVLCWLKEAGNAEQRTRLIETSRGFTAIPNVRSVAAGTSLPGGRGVVDATFDVAIHMTFANAAALQAYIDHPRHQQAVEEVLKPLTARVVVYDFSE